MVQLVQYSIGYSKLIPRLFSFLKRQGRQWLGSEPDWQVVWGGGGQGVQNCCFLSTRYPGSHLLFVAPTYLCKIHVLCNFAYFSLFTPTSWDLLSNLLYTSHPLFPRVPPSRRHLRKQAYPDYCFNYWFM